MNDNTENLFVQLNFIEFTKGLVQGIHEPEVTPCQIYAVDQYLYT